MQRPSTIKGEEEAKNGGQDRKSYLLNNFLPVAASKHESCRRARCVTTLPSATAGELRGPKKRPGSVEGSAAYVSCQISFPVAASRHRMPSPFSSRAKT